MDFVGDVHGCFGSVVALLRALGYALAFGRDGSVVRAAHPRGRTLVFLGDLVDRGGEVLAVLRTAVALAAGGHLVLLGNHDAALLRVLDAPAAPPEEQYPGWHTTSAALDAMAAPEREAVRRFLAACPHHALVEVAGEPRVVAVHAGLPLWAAGIDDERVRAHALYGDDRVSDSREALLADGTDWRATYTRGSGALCVYGHHAGAEPARVAQTLGIDTGCGYPGGRLSALRWPEGMVQSVAGTAPA